MNINTRKGFKKISLALTVFTGIAVFALANPANSKEITQAGHYRVQLPDAGDALNCRVQPSLKAEVANRYYHSETVKTVDVVKQNGRHWLQTTENCFVRGNSQYLQTAQATITPEKPGRGTDKGNGTGAGSGHVAADPITLMLSKHPAFESGTRRITLKPIGNNVEAPSRVIAVLAEEGLDDSIAGTLYRYEMQRTGNGQWRISKTFPTEQKCRPGRGQQTYSRARCS